MSSVSEIDLEKYADVIVRVGLNLRAGQRLLISAPVQALTLTEAVVKKAYQVGARYVDTILNNERITLLRYQHAPRDSFGEIPTWYVDLLTDYAKHGDAFLTIYAANPDLLKDQDPVLLQTAQKAQAEYSQEANMLIGTGAMNWLIVSVPVPSWSAKVLPE